MKITILAIALLLAMNTIGGHPTRAKERASNPLDQGFPIQEIISLKKKLLPLLNKFLPMLEKFLNGNQHQIPRRFKRTSSKDILKKKLLPLLNKYLTNLQKVTNYLDKIGKRQL